MAPMSVHPSLDWRAHTSVRDKPSAHGEKAPHSVASAQQTAVRQRPTAISPTKGGSTCTRPKALSTEQKYAIIAASPRQSGKLRAKTVDELSDGQAACGIQHIGNAGMLTYCGLSYTTQQMQLSSSGWLSRQSV